MSDWLMSLFFVAMGLYAYVVMRLLFRLFKQQQELKKQINEFKYEFEEKFESLLKTFIIFNPLKLPERKKPGPKPKKKDP